MQQVLSSTLVLVYQTGSSGVPNECHMCENAPSAELLRKGSVPCVLYLFTITGEVMKMLIYALSQVQTVER